MFAVKEVFRNEDREFFLRGIPDSIIYRPADDQGGEYQKKQGLESKAKLKAPGDKVMAAIVLFVGSSLLGQHLSVVSAT